MNLNMSQSHHNVNFRGFYCCQFPKAIFPHPDNFYEVERLCKRMVNGEYSELINHEVSKPDNFLSKIFKKIGLQNDDHVEFLEQPYFTEIHGEAKKAGVSMNWLGQHLGMELDTVDPNLHTYFVLTANGADCFTKLLNSQEIKGKFQNLISESENEDPKTQNLCTLAKMNEVLADLVNQVTERKITKHTELKVME